jgi:uncharacterized OsmC-like protein
MQPETIKETIRLWQEQPDKAKSKPSVKARSDGSQAIMEAGSFSWRSDLPQPLGGTNQAPSPTALLLSALAGCAVAFIRDTLAPQLGVRVEAVEATAQCEADSRGLLAMAGVAPDLQNIQLSIQVQSPDGDDKVQELYQAWRARCPIYLALIKPLQVTTHLEVKRG